MPPELRVNRQQSTWRLLVGLGLVVAGCTEREVDSSPQHVLLITLDTTRIEMLGSYGGPGRTPHLDALAETSLRFERSLTPKAVRSI